MTSNEPTIPAAPSRIEIVAPLSGVVVPLDAVPDPVFARGMVGGGVAIDPTTCEVLAPVAGVVTQLHRAHHAVVVTTADGLEVLVHVGLDTVGLDGRGFTPVVSVGARVECGQPLLRFDPEVVAAGARSLVTAVVVTSGNGIARLEPASGLVEAGTSVLLRVALGAAPGAGPSPGGDTAVSEPVVLPNPAGLHARPAALLADEARRFAGGVSLLRGADEVNAKSVVAILGLSTRRGDEVRVKATGAGAREEVARLARLLAEGCGEAPGAAPEPAGAAVVVALRGGGGAKRPAGELAGVPASPGLAIGNVFQYRRAAIVVPDRGGTPAEERDRLDTAIREAARQIDAVRQYATDASRAQFLGVHLSLLEDPELVRAAEALVAAGKSAAFAWQAAFTQHAGALEALESPLLRERAADVRDVGRRVLVLLSGGVASEPAIPEGAVVISEELSPSEVAAFDKTRVHGFCTATGGSTSHVAILARSIGIPAVCGVDEAALALPEGMRVVVDGTRGTLRPAVDDAAAAEVQARMARIAVARQADAAAAFRPARTRCGHRVEVVANVRGAEDAREALAAGAEGVGLLRSEFLFLRRETAPTEEEQTAAYRAVAEAVGKERPLIIRTLDVGGDKPLPYLPMPKEENPFLGVRGIRVSLANPELFRAQLRAILRAAPLSNTHIMFPMIATLEEVREAKQILAEEQRAIPHAAKVGIMIEVPSAVILAELLARELDFFSIGTNDLTQYTLAMDRNHPRLGRHADALHPAVLRMIALTVEGAHEHGKWVGVCGGLASDPLAAPVLVGLGVDELSVDTPAIGPVKAALAQWSLDDCAELATEVLRQRTAGGVREVLQARSEAADPTAADRVLP